MTTGWRSSLLLLLAACSFPRPADVNRDAGDTPAGPSTDASGGPSADASGSAPADAPTDAPDLPNTVLHVSNSGDDANDGLTKPVKTLKHAIGLAAANHQIMKIDLASGRYSSASGETFPYTVPANLTIVGPAGGGAILAGTKAEPGMTVDVGTLQDLDLENFTTAITATGVASITNIRVMTSAIAMQAETAAKVTVDHLDVAGTAGACATGIVLNGAARATATTFSTRNLGTTVDARDQSTIAVGNASVSGDRACTQSTSIMLITSSGSFALSDSLLDGGGFQGLRIIPTASSFQATISNTIVRNMKGDAISAGSGSASMLFEMIGGELSNNGGVGAQVSSGRWTFTNVAIRQNVGLAIYSQDGILIMRGCTITSNGSGIDIFDNVSADLGTVANPGNNVLQGNAAVGLSLDGSAGAKLINAIGNTWNPITQGTDTAGKYATPTTVSTPVAAVNGNNFSINAGWSLMR